MPPYARGFGQSGLAANQGYTQAFPSSLASKPLTPPGLGNRVSALGNQVAAPGGGAAAGLSHLGASGLGNPLPRSSGLGSHLGSSGLFNHSMSQPAPSRFQNQLGQNIGGLQRQGNGQNGYGDSWMSMAGPPGLNLGPSAGNSNLSANSILDYAQLKQANQRQLIQELQNQQMLRQQVKTHPIAHQHQPQPQNAQAQLFLERREQLRQLMQQGLLDLTPQQLQQLQAQQLLLSQQGGLQQQSAWPARTTSPGLNNNSMLNPNAGHRLFQPWLLDRPLERGGWKFDAEHSLLSLLLLYLHRIYGARTVTTWRLISGWLLL